MTTFAQEWWDFRERQSEWEEGLYDLIGEFDFDKLGTDGYDCSLEIYKASDDLRLSAEAQAYCRDAGFGKVYVNHKDGWQTHYSELYDAELPLRGWRRKTNPKGGFFISYWPEGWNTERTADWLKTGYMTIVPDKLDPSALQTTERETGE